MQLFYGQSTDGASAEFKHPDGSKFLNVWVAGDLGGGTVWVEAQTPDGLEFVPLEGSSTTEAQMFTIEAAPFVGRLILSGSTGASVDAWVELESIAWSAKVRKG